jgi:hypothetical protein
VPWAVWHVGVSDTVRTGPGRGQGSAAEAEELPEATASVARRTPLPSRCLHATSRRAFFYTCLLRSIFGISSVDHLPATLKGDER